MLKLRTGFLLKNNVAYMFSIVWLLVLLLLSGCSSAEEAQHEGEFDLEQRHTLGDFGFSIAYPSGWFADTQETVTILSEIETDHRRAIRAEEFDVEGYQITFEHEDMEFMSGLGLPDEPSLADLFALNARLFEWEAEIAMTETTVFGVRALRVARSEDTVGRVILMGFREGEAFLLGFEAPSREARDLFLPTWARILASIQPADN